MPLDNMDTSGVDTAAIKSQLDNDPLAERQTTISAFSSPHLKAAFAAKRQQDAEVLSGQVKPSLPDNSDPASVSASAMAPLVKTEPTAVTPAEPVQLPEKPSEAAGDSSTIAPAGSLFETNNSSAPKPVSPDEVDPAVQFYDPLGQQQEIDSQVIARTQAERRVQGYRDKGLPEEQARFLGDPEAAAYHDAIQDAPNPFEFVGPGAIMGAVKGFAIGTAMSSYGAVGPVVGAAMGLGTGVAMTVPAVLAAPIISDTAEAVQQSLAPTDI